VDCEMHIYCACGAVEEWESCEGDEAMELVGACPACGSELEVELGG
jgi:transcription initiation factor IIE alpha subunit